MTYFSALVLISLIVSALASKPSIKDDPCEQYAETSHRWQDLRMKPIKIVQLDECVLVYRDDDKGLVSATGGDDGVLQVSNATQVVMYAAQHGVATKVANVGRKGLKEGQTGIATYCMKCRYLLQILVGKE